MGLKRLVVAGLLTLCSFAHASPEKGTYVITTGLLPDRGYTYEMVLLGNERTHVTVVASDPVPLRCIVYRSGTTEQVSYADKVRACTLDFNVPKTDSYYVIVLNMSSKATDATIVVQ